MKLKKVFSFLLFFSWWLSWFLPVFCGMRRHSVGREAVMVAEAGVRVDM